MLRRRETKNPEEDNNTAESAAAAEPGRPRQSVDTPARGINWTPLRQTNEAWRPERSSAPSSDESLIGPEDFFNGAYSSVHGVRVQGRVEGSIESKERIIIDPGAKVDASLRAEDVVIAGEYNGRVDCRRRLEITPTGVVSGEINTELLVVQEGGFFEGKLKMTARAQPAEPTPEPTPAPNPTSRAPKSTVSDDDEEPPTQV